MSQNIPAPRDGASPVATSATRPRPWPSTRRVILPVVAAAALVLVPAGTAFACIFPPQPPQPPVPSCGHPYPCPPPTTTPIVPPTSPDVPPTSPDVPPTWPVEPTKTHPVKPPKTHPVKPPKTHPVTTPPTTPAKPTPTPTPTPTGGTCTSTPGGADTCHVVTGNPSFTG